MFFYCLFVFFCPSGFSSPLVHEDVCITGFTAHQSDTPVQNGYELSQIAGSPEALVQTPIRQWLTQQKWQAAYKLWQESRLCRNRFDTGENFVCEQKIIPLPAEDECQGVQDGYEFLVMHRYLLQTLRSLWPQLNDPFTGWPRFPQVEDYPSFLQARFYAWPNVLLDKVPNLSSGGAQNHAGNLPDENASLRREQWLARWKTEGELGQWLQCGTLNKGMGMDSLYRALSTNAMPGDHRIHPMDLYLFWKNHGWIDQVWEDYRLATGKTTDDPQLQAALIQQCRVHHAWTKQTSGAPRPAAEAMQEDFIYRDGELNHRQAGKNLRVLGEIIDIQRGPLAKTFIKIDVRRVGVKPIWVSSFLPIADGMLKQGNTHEFIGTVERTDVLDPSGEVRRFLQSPTLLLLKSLQSPK